MWRFYLHSFKRKWIYLSLMCICLKLSYYGLKNTWLGLSIREEETLSFPLIFLFISIFLLHRYFYTHTHSAISIIYKNPYVYYIHVIHAGVTVELFLQIVFSMSPAKRLRYAKRGQDIESICGIMGCILSFQNLYVEILTLSISEYDCIWR